MFLLSKHSIQISKYLDLRDKGYFKVRNSLYAFYADITMVSVYFQIINETHILLVLDILLDAIPQTAVGHFQPKQCPSPLGLANCNSSHNSGILSIFTFYSWVSIVMMVLATDVRSMHTWHPS